MPRSLRLAINLLCCLVLGCAGGAPPKRPLVWDLSNNRKPAAFNGGVWVPPDPGPSEEGHVYHVTGDEGVSLTLILPDERRFDFDSVKDAYVTKRDGTIRTIDIASFGYSESDVIAHLKSLHEKWSGNGIGEIDKWRTDIHKGSLRPHLTLIHQPTDPNDPSISAAIHYNFGGTDSAWFIMVTFLWNTP
ncbi:MAG TPA: hypothetical protein VGK58_22320 [Lacipirellulaceae bacterium]